MSYDNRILKINGENLTSLKQAMQIVDPKMATGYVKDKNKGLVFFDYGHEKMIPFPSKLSMTECANLAYRWLEDEAVYPNEPDHDGHNNKGWLVYCDGWGYIDGYSFGSFLAVLPHWLMIGK